MKRRRVVALIAVSAIVAGFATAGIAGARVPAQATRGVTDKSIKVAGLGYSDFYKDSEVGARAVFKRVNDGGGVHGRTIEFGGWNDDGSDPTKNLSEGRRLVQQEQVFAVVPTITPYLGAADFFKQQKVPFVGWGVASGFCGNSYAVAFTGCLTPPPPITSAGGTWGALLNDMFKAKGETGAKGKTAAVISEDSDGGKTGNKVIAASAKYAGMKVTYGKAAVPAPPATVGDYSPFVTDIMTSNKGGPPDVVFLTMAYANVSGMAAALNQAGYKGVVTNAVAYDTRLVSTATGQVVFTQFATPEAPAMAHVAADIKAVSDAPITQAVLAGYFSAEYFVKILEKVGKNLTPEAFAKARNKVTFEIPNVIGPTKYPTAEQYGSPCGQLTQSNGTEYKIVAPYKCYTNVTLKGLKPIPYKL